MGRRSRSRSRSRDRHKSSRRRTRSRSRSRDRRRERKASGFSDGSAAGAAGGAPGVPVLSEAEAMQQAMAQLQQQQLQKQLLAQQLMMQQQAMAGSVAVGGNSSSNRKQRELYVGNLAVGAVTDETLKQLFNGALAHLVPDPINNPPCVSARVDPTGGRFGFVELRTEELSTAGLMLDKVELAGRQINVGRPKGYVEPPGGAPQPQMGIAALLAQQLANQPTTVLLLENMLPARTLLEEQERKDLAEDVGEEAGRHGTLLDTCVPKPPDGVGSLETGRCYLKFASPADSLKAKEVFDGRTFDGNKVKATFVSEDDFNAAKQNAWLPPKPEQASAAAPQQPPTAIPSMGLAALGGMHGGMSGAPMGMPGAPGALPGPPVMPGMPGM